MARSVFREELRRDLREASYKGNLEEVRKIVSNFMVDINSVTGQDGTSALHLAACNGHNDVVIYLLDRGANLEAQTNGGSTALWLAVFFRHKVLVQLLLERGANVNAQIYGNTAMNLADFFK